jgi:hypothetical protein
VLAGVIIGIVVGVIVVVMLLITLVGRRRGYSGMGGDTIVRCSKGHLFTTIWVPGVSFKSVRLGFKRFQHCPIGHHWTMVRPVDVATLSDEEKTEAEAHHDVHIA